MASTAKQVDILIVGLRDPNTDEPAAQYEVETYLDGTSTKSNLWTDRQKTAQAQNPITLDSFGRADVYGDNIYKFEVYEPRDADGNQGAHVRTITGVDLFTSTPLDSEWRLQNDSPDYVSSTSFTVAGDQTEQYHAGRRLRMEGTSTGTIYGTIDSSSYDSGANKTTVTVTWDSGALSNEELTVYLSVLSNDNQSIPQDPQVKTLTASGSISGDTLTASGAISGATVNTGQGDNEVYAMDQAVKTTSDVLHKTLDVTDITTTRANLNLDAPNSINIPGIGFHTWRVPNNNKSTFVMGATSLESDDIAYEESFFKIDESGGTSADHSVQIDFVPDNFDKPQVSSFAFIVPPGMSYQITYRTGTGGTQSLESLIEVFF